MKRVVSVLLCVILLLSLAACGEKMEPNSQAVATYGGQEITQQQLLMEIAVYVSQYGMTVDMIREDTAVWEQLCNSFLDTMILEYIITERAGQLGYVYDDEQESLFEEEYQQFLQALDANNRSQAMAESADGELSDQELLKLRDAYFQALGYTAEGHRARQERSFILAQVKELLTGSLSVSDEEVRAYYDEHAVAGNQNPVVQNFNDALGSGVPLYYADGYKYVKPLYIAFPPSVVRQAAGMYERGEDAQLESLLNREVELLQPTLDEIRAKMESNVSFDQLIAEYGEDDGMTVEPYATRGYLVSTAYDQLVESYRIAVESLEAVGDVAECATYKGYWFLYAYEIVDRGPAPFEEVQSAIRQAVLQLKQQEAWGDMTRQLIDETQEEGRLVIHSDLLESLGV